MLDPETDLLIAFVQTRHHPELSETELLREWLVDRGLLVPEDRFDDDDARRMRHVRAALNALMAANTGTPVDARTAATIASVTAASPLQIRVNGEGALTAGPTTGGVDGALTRLVAAAYVAMAKGVFPRLKACKKCGYAFYDESKNRSRVWCDMALCGSQEKAKAYRARQPKA